MARKLFVDRIFPTRRMARCAAIVARDRPAPQWHWSAAEIAAIVRSVPEDRRARTIAAAEDLLNRRFAFRGTDPVTLAPGEWAPSSVSHDWICDLNRHHWFATLGFAYRYSGDARFFREFVIQSSDWMDRHLSRLGRLDWDSPFEVASRINAWVWAHFLFLGSPAWEPAHYQRFVRGLGLLAEYLYQTIEYHSPGNHILLEAKTLALCGEAFPEFVGASRWRRKGWRIVAAELRAQICRDGVHVERSTLYHRIIAGELAELWRFCEGNQLPAVDVIGDALRRMAGFETWIDQGGGRLPLFGDAHVEDSYSRMSARAVAAAEQGCEARNLITEPTDHSFWLLGSDGLGDAHPRSAASPPVGPAFFEGGYFVARSAGTPRGDVLVWDCGPIGYQRNRKHAHLDTLSFTLSVAGTPLLIDPGTDEADDRREALRSTRAHSTVSVDGLEQGILAPRGEIWSPPRPELLLWATSDECAVMSGRHDGYRRLREPVWHMRTILAMHGLYWLVVDRFEGSGEHRVEQRFHVAPGALVVVRDEGGGVELTKDGIALSLDWARDDAPPRIRIEPSMAELHCGRPEPTCIVIAEGRGRVPFDQVVVASAGRGVRVSRALGTADMGRLAVVGPGFEHQVYLSRGARRNAPIINGWGKDTRVAIVRSPSGGELGDILLVDAGESNGAGGIRRIALLPETSVPQ